MEQILDEIIANIANIAKAAEAKKRVGMLVNSS
jgi:hypothetical protein